MTKEIGIFRSEEYVMTINYPHLQAHHGFKVGQLVEDRGGFVAIHNHPESTAKELNIVSDMFVIKPEDHGWPKKVKRVPVVYARDDDYRLPKDK
jgi:hypothetical protein